MKRFIISLVLLPLFLALPGCYCGYNGLGFGCYGPVVGGYYGTSYGYPYHYGYEYPYYYGGPGYYYRGYGGYRGYYGGCY